MVESFVILFVMLKMMPERISTYVLYVRREHFRKFLYGPTIVLYRICICIQKCQKKCVSVHLDTCILYDKIIDALIFHAKFLLKFSRKCHAVTIKIL